jgi:double-stranded uracil-DNA glycosylase
VHHITDLVAESSVFVSPTASDRRFACVPFVQSFPPVAAPRARVLILGSMPGQASLAARQYYAHPRNAFWPVLGAILGFDPTLPYAERLDRLQAGGVALWDVLQSCERSGSLDAAIEPTSQRPNDFAAWFAGQPELRAVCCNGATAHRLFVRAVLPTLPVAGSDRTALVVHRLPSTSPAHAGLAAADKLAAWRQALAPHLA